MLIVEDGTGLPTADSYVSLGEASSLANELGLVQEWGAIVADAAGESALRMATIYLDGHYDWRGTILEETQALGWPREDAVDHQGRAIAEDAVPKAVKRGVVYLATQTGSNRLEPTFDDAGLTSERIGDASWTWNAAQREQRSFPELDSILRGLYEGPGQSGGFAMLSLERA